MTTFVQLTVSGLANGAVLALAALGFVLIYKATQVINFAQGHFLLVGAFVIWSFVVQVGLHWSVALFAAMAVAVIIGLLVERLVLRPMVGENPIAVIMVTIGLAAILESIVQMLWGVTPRRLPEFIPTGVWRIAGVTVPKDRIFAVVIAAIVLFAFSLFFTRSRHGIAMRAVADDQQAALTQGISVRRVFAMAWALAALSAVIGGVLLANLTGVSGTITQIGLLVFAVVIVGGLDSIPGAIVGGAIVGLLQQYTAGYVGGGLQQVVPYVALVLILLVRPYGLFGEIRIERV